MSNKSKIFRCKAPLRLSFAGGGTDVDPYASEIGGAVINSTINKYAYCTLIPREDDKIKIKSFDLDVSSNFKTNEDFNFDGKLDLATAVLRNFIPTSGFDLYMHCEAPPGSGLGSSSTVMLSIIGVFKEWLGIDLTKHEMAELAYKLERIDLGLNGGKQDQFASSYGGFNYIEFGKSETVVNNLKISLATINELEYRSILVYTGKSRFSANIIEEQQKNYKSGSNLEALNKTKLLSSRMKNSIINADFDLFGDCLNEGWKLKKKFTDKISSPQIDQMYDTAIDNGAIGGKITGAGGGGFMYLFCKFDKKQQVIESIKKLGGKVYDFSFESQGCQSWSVNGRK